MDGRPVWLASVSQRIKGRLHPTTRWTNRDLLRAEETIDDVLKGLGDIDRQRSFRMPITLCRHRALTDDELERLPDWWWAEPPRHIAGGPLEILWKVGVEDAPSTLPCHHPDKQRLNPIDPDLFVVLDCGTCEPCKARLATVDH